MAITFGILIAVMTAITLLKPLREPKILPTKGTIDLKPASAAKWLGLAVILATIALYIKFW
jgi:SSS family solute:Na+ symporter